MSYNRRTFVKSVAAATAVLPFSGTFASEAAKISQKKYPVAFFTKALDNYELAFMAETLSMAGVDGLDLAVRPKGRVEPERVADDLGAVIETGKKFNLITEMMVTAVTDASDVLTENLLRTASKLGVKHYRLGYYDYDYKVGISESLKTIQKSVELLAHLNKEIGIQGGYQNHSGIKFGAPSWDLWKLIQNIPPEWMSSQFDVRHAVTEGASSWILALRLLGKNIGSLAIKDFTWQLKGRKAQVLSVPLGEGIVDFDLYFRTIKELNIDVPITLHVEYPLLSPEEEKLTLIEKQKILVQKIKKDVGFIRTQLNKNHLI